MKSAQVKLVFCLIGLAFLASSCGTHKSTQSLVNEGHKIDLLGKNEDETLRGAPKKVSPAPSKKLASQHKKNKKKKQYASSKTPVQAPAKVLSPAPKTAPANEPPKAQNLSRETQTIIKTAETYLNTPYRFGGLNNQGIDCSGLTVMAFKSVGITLPRIAGDQAAFGKPISRKEVKPGDLLFFYASKPGIIGHTGLVVQTVDNSIKFIHATTSRGVRYDYLESEHWTQHYICARRILNR